MILHKAQNSIASDTHRFRVVNCGRQFGKTTLSIEEIKGVALSKNANIVYIAPTIQQARDIAWVMLKNELKGIIIKSKEAPSLEIEVSNLLGGTSTIKLRGWEAVETLRGQQFDLIILDEVASMRNFWLSWQEVLLATLTFRKGQAMFISTPKGFNHFYDLYNFESKDPDFKSFNYSSYDNPFLDPEELENTKSKSTEDRFAQEYMADFRKQEGLVYKEFQRAFHVFKDPPNKEWIKTFGGHDFGTHNPCASITIKKDRDSNYYVWDEHYVRGMTDAEQADYVASLKWDECYPDPESASGILEFKKRGINVRQVIKNKDSVRNGINVVKELFKTGRLRIHESCQNLIYELETYAYAEKRQDRNEEENPIKENDHALDALRYALSMHNTQRDLPPVFRRPHEQRKNPAR